MKAKISEMLPAVSTDYIALGRDLEHKRQLLFGAVSAWNIACLPPQRREAALKDFMVAFQGGESRTITAGVRRCRRGYAPTD